MYPSCPEAMYSLVTILYVRPSFSLLINSPSTRTGVPIPELEPEVVLELPLVPELADGDLGASCNSQIPSTRWPGGRRESQETRKPDTIENRLEITRQQNSRENTKRPLAPPAQDIWITLPRAHPTRTLRLAQARQWDHRKAKSLGYFLR